MDSKFKARRAEVRRENYRAMFANTALRECMFGLFLGKLVAPDMQSLAPTAVAMADAMLAELDKKEAGKK